MESRSTALLILVLIGCARAQTDVVTRKESSEYYYDSPDNHDGNCGHMTSWGTASSYPFNRPNDNVYVRFKHDSSSTYEKIIDGLNMNQSFSKHLSLNHSWDGINVWQLRINLVNLTNIVKGEYSVWLRFSSPTRFRPKLLGPLDVMPNYTRRALFNIVEVNFTHPNPSYIRALRTQQGESKDVNRSCQCMNDTDRSLAVDFKLSDNTQWPCGYTHDLLNISLNATLKPPEVDWCVGVGLAWFSISGLSIEWPKISGIKLIGNSGYEECFAVSKDTMTKRTIVSGSNVRLQYNVSGCDDTCWNVYTLDKKMIKSVDYPNVTVTTDTTPTTIELTGINTNFIRQIIVENVADHGILANETVNLTSVSIEIQLTSGMVRLVYGNGNGNYSDRKCDFFEHPTLIDLNSTKGGELFRGLAVSAICMSGLMFIVLIVVLVVSCKKRGKDEQKSSGKQMKIPCIVCGAVLAICLGLSIAASCLPAGAESKTAWLVGVWIVFGIDSLLFLGIIINLRSLGKR